jgi:hypothetical protein
MPENTGKRRHRGRPTADAKLGEKSTVSIRMSPELKDFLNRAAWLNDRPLSQEAEFRLEQSLYKQNLLPDVLSLAYGRELAGILMAVAVIMVETGREVAGRRGLATLDRWVSDPVAFEYAIDEARELLGHLRPGDVPSPAEQAAARPTETSTSWRLLSVLRGDPEHALDFVEHPNREIQELLSDRLRELSARPAMKLEPAPTDAQRRVPRAPGPPPDLQRRLMEARVRLEHVAKQRLELRHQIARAEAMLAESKRQVEALKEEQLKAVKEEADLSSDIEAISAYTARENGNEG